MRIVSLLPLDMPMPSKPDFSRVNLSQLARLHGVSRTTVYDWIGKGLPRNANKTFSVEQSITWRAWHTGADGRVHRVARTLPELAISDEQLASELAQLEELE